MSKAERQREIISILRIRKYEKVDNLAFHFGVSARTIKNDILDLTCYYPIYTKQGKYEGGIYWDIYNTWKDDNVTEVLAFLTKIKSVLKTDKQKTLMDRAIKLISKA